MMKSATTTAWAALEGVSLSIKLKYLEQWNNRRRQIAKIYHQKIKNSKIKMQSISDWSDGIYHLFVVTSPYKDELVKHMTENNIIPAFHYPVPCHLQKAYSHLGYKKGDFPNSEYLADQCVSLPMFAELTDEEVNRVVEVLNAF